MLDVADLSLQADPHSALSGVHNAHNVEKCALPAEWSCAVSVEPPGGGLPVLTLSHNTSPPA